MKSPFPYEIGSNDVTISEAQMGAVIAAAEARGRELGRREAIDKLRERANSRWLAVGDEPMLNAAADFLEESMTVDALNRGNPDPAAVSDPCPVCGQDNWPVGSAGNARRTHELAEHEGDPRIKPRWWDEEKHHAEAGPDLRTATEAEADQQAAKARAAKALAAGLADHEELHRTLARIQGRHP